MLDDIPIFEIVFFYKSIMWYLYETITKKLAMSSNYNLHSCTVKKCQWGMLAHGYRICENCNNTLMSH